MTTTDEDQPNFWPSMVDLVVSATMVVSFVLYLQVLENVGSREVLKVLESRDRFIAYLNQNFATERDRGDIAWSWDSGRLFLKITYSDKALFDSCDYHLKPGGIMLLDRQAEALREASRVSRLREVQVAGHTDKAPIAGWCKGACSPGDMTCWRPTDNWQLSAARAIAVVKELQQGSGLDGSFFSANSYSEHHPIDDHDVARNRRIEVKISFSSEPVGPPP